MTKVAIENGLADVRDALQSSGYEVVSIDQAGDAACAVVTGLDPDVLGIAETDIRASIIQARGLSASEIVEQVKQHMQQVK
jgi:hypothetical protein